MRIATPKVNQNLFDDLYNSKVDGGELFWFHGREFQLGVGDIYLLPEEIKAIIKHRDE